MFESQSITEVVCRPMLPPVDCVRVRLLPCRQDPVSGRLGFRIPGTPGLWREQESNLFEKHYRFRKIAASRLVLRILFLGRTISFPPSLPVREALRHGRAPRVLHDSAMEKPGRATAWLSSFFFSCASCFDVLTLLNRDAGSLVRSGGQVSCPGGHLSSTQEITGSPPCERASTFQLSILVMSLFEAKRIRLPAEPAIHQQFRRV